MTKSPSLPRQPVVSLSRFCAKSTSIMHSSLMSFMLSLSNAQITRRSRILVSGLDLTYATLATRMPRFLHAMHSDDPHRPLSTLSYPVAKRLSIYLKNRWVPCSPSLDGVEGSSSAPQMCVVQDRATSCTTQPVYSFPRVCLGLG